MALMHLVATNDQNYYLPMMMAHDFNEISVDWNGIESSDNTKTTSTLINKNGDTCKIKYIQFKSNTIQSVEEFKSLLKDSTFELKLNYTMLNVTRSVGLYHFDYLMEFNEVKKYGNNFIVKIPHEYTVDEIYLICLQNENLSVVLNIQNPNMIDDVSLSVQYCFYESFERLDFARNAHSKLYQNIVKCVDFNYGQTSQTSQTRFVHMVNGQSLTKGFFIKGNIAKIEEFRLSILGHNRFVYSNALLNIYSHKISNDLIYVSYSGENNYKDMTCSSYVGSLNMRMVDIRIVITVNNLQSDENIKIYSISSMYFNYSNRSGDINNVPLVNTIPYGEHYRRRILERQPLQSEQQHGALSPNEWYTEYGCLNNDKNICPITRQPIESEYCLCLTCHNAFDYLTLQEWLKIKNTCPMCRLDWINNIKYIKIVGLLGKFMVFWGKFMLLAKIVNNCLINNILKKISMFVKQIDRYIDRRIC